MIAIIRIIIEIPPQYLLGQVTGWGDGFFPVVKTFYIIITDYNFVSCISDILGLMTISSVGWSMSSLYIVY